MVEHDTRVLAVTIAVLVLSTIFVALRFISRACVLGKVGVHDYFILSAWLVSFGLSFSICYGTARGLGLRTADIPPDWLPSLKRAIYSFSVLYNPALMLTKTSILLFYLSLMSRYQSFRWLTYLTLIIVNTAGLGLTLINILRCSPVSAAFSYPVPNGSRCTDILTLSLSSVPINIITDLAILILPLPLLTRMKLPLKQKIILLLTFGVGIFVTLVSVFRIIQLQNASIAHVQAPDGNIPFEEKDIVEADFPWYASRSFMWSAIEVNVGIACACVPTLKPLITKILPKLIRGTSISGSHPESLNPSGLESNAPTINSICENLTPLPHTANRNWRSRDLDSINLESHGDQQPEPKNPRNASASQRVRSRSRSNPRKGPQDANIPFFDFVDMNNAKSMVELSNKESMPVLSVITVVLFLWGFAYGLLGILNAQFLLIAKMHPSQVNGLHAAYFGGYFLGPILGVMILNKAGFRLTFVVGLCIYACGILLFWPSAVLASYAAFLIANLIAGSGFSIVQTSAHPFIALCGPPEYSEIRMNVSLGFQAIGGSIAPLLAKRVLFRSATDIQGLIRVQWLYLGIVFFDVFLAVAFQYMAVPEATNAQLEKLAHQRKSANSTKIANVPIIWITLGLALFTLFLYFGAQEGTNVHFQALITAIKPDATAFECQTIGYAFFAAGRFATAGAQRFAKPRSILLFLCVSVVISTILSMHISGTGGIAVALFIYVFQSGIFGLIFAISLRGMGRYTKSAAALLTSAMSGGAAFTFAQQSLVNRRGIRFSFLIEAVLFSVCGIFAIYLNLVPAAQRQTDLNLHPNLDSDQGQLKLEKGKNLPLSSRSKRLDESLAQQEETHEGEALGKGPGVDVDESLFPSAETIARCIQRAQYRFSDALSSVHNEGGIMHSLASWHAGSSVTSLDQPRSVYSGTGQQMQPLRFSFSRQQGASPPSPLTVMSSNPPFP